jgi:hypothetical protein
LKRTNSAESDPVFHKPANVIGMNFGFNSDKLSKKSIFRNQNLYGHEYSSILENSQEFANPVYLKSPINTLQELELIPHMYIPGSKRSVSHQTPYPWGKAGIEIESRISKDSNFLLKAKESQFFKKDTNSNLEDMGIYRKDSPRVHTTNSNHIISDMLGVQRPPNIIFNADSKTDTVSLQRWSGR